MLNFGLNTQNQNASVPNEAFGATSNTDNQGGWGSSSNTDNQGGWGS